MLPVHVPAKPSALAGAVGVTVVAIVGIAVDVIVGETTRAAVAGVGCAAVGVHAPMSRIIKMNKYFVFTLVSFHEYQVLSLAS